MFFKNADSASAIEQNLSLDELSDAQLEIVAGGMSFEVFDTWRSNYLNENLINVSRLNKQD